MEKLTDRVAALPRDSRYFSLEFFPPKTQIGFSNLQSRLERMTTALRPLFVTVTWGAGGTTSSRSLELAEICQRQLGLTTCLHMTCTNMKRSVVDQALEEAKVMGVRNILALRGDAPRDYEYRIENGTTEEEGSNEDFTWAVDLVRYIRRKHGDFFCIGVAAYPEGHSDLSHPDDQDIHRDLPFLLEKVKAGADFMMTQLFYDVESYNRFERMLREHESGLFKTMPIIPGLMPIQSYSTLRRVCQLSHAKLPSSLLAEVEPLKGDDEAVKRVGMDALCEMIASISSTKLSNPRGFHFYTLNLEKVVSEILDRSNLIPLSPEDEVAVSDQLLGNSAVANGSPRGRTLSSSSASAAAQLTINSHRASSLSRLTVPLSSSNPSSTLQEAAWDDYPNGRFGDARSPAFNAPLTYSMISFNVSADQALALWGTPTTPSDLTQLFASHLTRHTPSQLPWSESATLSPEIALIKPHLISLTEAKAFLTIASQPAVNGLPSNHAIHGWGPAGGFVFQKAFVEFFISAPTFQETLRPALHRLHAAGEVAWYAINSRGSFESSEPASAVHAVTWGSFKGKEIATATMVEEVAFRAWGEEAFGIWAEWARCYGEVARNRRSEDGEKARLRQAREFLMKAREEMMLVNVIGHDYIEGDRLWDVLLRG